MAYPTKHKSYRNPVKMNMQKDLLTAQGSESTCGPRTHELMQDTMALDQNRHNTALTSHADSLRYLFEHAPLTAQRMGSVPVLQLARTSLQSKAPRPWLRGTKQTNHLRSPLRKPLPLSPEDTPKAKTLPVAVSSPSHASTATCSVKSAEQEPTICSFFYHFGTCRKDPESSTFDGSAKTCKFVHSLGTETETLKVQKVPNHWHRKPCGLVRCPQSGGTRKESKLAKKAASGFDGSQSEPGDSALVAYTIPEDVIEAETTAPLTVQVNPGQFNESQTMKFDSAASFKISDAITVGQRNGLPNYNKNGAKKRKRMDELSKEPVTPATATVTPKDPSAKAKRYTGEVCFFWYHGSCKRGRHCPMLHEMTNPPSFVQPPPGYIHNVPCRLDWCSGDKRHEFEHEHEHEGAADCKISAKRLCIGLDHESGPEEGEVGR